jgi:hypothetical protein
VQYVEKNDFAICAEDNKGTPRNGLKSYKEVVTVLKKLRETRSEADGSNDSVSLSVRKTRKPWPESWGDEAGKPTPELAMPCPETSLSALHVRLQGTELCFGSSNHSSVPLTLQDLIRDHETRDRELICKRCSFTSMLLVNGIVIDHLYEKTPLQAESFVRAMLLFRTQASIIVPDPSNSSKSCLALVHDGMLSS